MKKASRSAFKRTYLARESPDNSLEVCVSILCFILSSSSYFFNLSFHISFSHIKVIYTYDCDLGKQLNIYKKKADRKTLYLSSARCIRQNPRMPPNIVPDIILTYPHRGDFIVLSSFWCPPPPPLAFLRCLHCAPNSNTNIICLTHLMGSSNAGQNSKHTNMIGPINKFLHKFYVFWGSI